MGAYIGDDGAAYYDPCTSGAGKPKQRWPNEDAAWFVVDKFVTQRKNPRTLYAYRCPKCEGWHLATASTPHKLRKHLKGLAAIRKKMSLRAPENGHDTGHGLTTNPPDA